MLEILQVLITATVVRIAYLVRTWYCSLLTRVANVALGYALFLHVIPAGARRGTSLPVLNVMF
jgi:hypothetical protein